MSSIESTLPSEFSKRHFEKGCTFKDLYCVGDNSELWDNIDYENYVEDKSKYDDDFYDFE